MEEALLQIFIQGGAVGISIFLVWNQRKERESSAKDRREERADFQEERKEFLELLNHKSSEHTRAVNKLGSLMETEISVNKEIIKFLKRDK